MCTLYHGIMGYLFALLQPQCCMLHVQQRSVQSAQRKQQMSQQEVDYVLILVLLGCSDLPSRLMSAANVPAEKQCLMALIQEKQHRTFRQESILSRTTTVACSHLLRFAIVYSMCAATWHHRRRFSDCPRTQIMGAMPRSRPA
jgi:hypothetical protein